MTVTEILEAIKGDDIVIVIDDSPLLRGAVTTSEILNDPENEILFVDWVDNGHDRSVKFTEFGLGWAAIEGNTIRALDHEDKFTTIQVFKLQPLNL